MFLINLEEDSTSFQSISKLIKVERLNYFIIKPELENGPYFLILWLKRHLGGEWRAALLKNLSLS